MLAAETRPMRHGHAEALMPLVDAVMHSAGLRPGVLDAVAVSLGPGGFTGIRVGLAAAHGIALASGARLVGVSSFATVVAGLPEPLPGPVLTALDSRRADLYVQLFSAERVSLGEPGSVQPERLGEWVEARIGPTPLLVAGDAAAAAVEALAEHSGATVAPGSAPDARGVLAAAAGMLAAGEAAAPPQALYLRPPDVTIAPAAPRAETRRGSRRIGPLPAAAAGPLALLHRACFPDDPWEADALARIMGLSGCFGRLAWDDDTPIGFVLARDLGTECEVLSVGVSPKLRQHGAGAQLMHAVLAEARRRGNASVVLEVAADNQPARALYTRLGFATVGRRPRYYRRPNGLEDALIMRLTLPDSASGR